MGRIFCIGDIHGCPATLNELLINRICLNKSDKLIFLGDYIDRGPDSKAVIDIILDLERKNYDVTCLIGNHEEMFIDSYHDDEIYEHWVLNCGGNKTLSSFGIITFEELNEFCQYFFKTLLYHKTINRKYILVHAGLNFNNADIFEDKYTMIWGRSLNINYDILKDRYIIHGHTPQTLERVVDQLNIIDKKKIINLDTGCCFKNVNGLGNLTALELNSMKLFSVANIDKFDF
jgi:serine/threonine protein phosphatase 1